MIGLCAHCIRDRRYVERKTFNGRPVNLCLDCQDEIWRDVMRQLPSAASEMRRKELGL